MVDSWMKRELPASIYRSFHDLMLPTRDGMTQIDHVSVSRSGVFVVETKNMGGWIFGERGRDGEIHHRPSRDVTLSAPKSVSLLAPNRRPSSLPSEASPASIMAPRPTPAGAGPSAAAMIRLALAPS